MADSTDNLILEHLHEMCGDIASQVKELRGDSTLSLHYQEIEKALCDIRRNLNNLKRKTTLTEADELLANASYLAAVAEKLKETIED